MALFDILSVNAQSLTTFQKGIDLTNKNINNVYNKDYARERPIFEELPGYGVNMADAHRVFDRRYFDRYLKENQTLAFHQNLSSNLEGLEAIFNDINGTGFAADINEYFTKVNDLVNEPNNMAARESFLVSARKLVTKLKGTYDSLENEKTNLNIAIEKEVEEINRLTTSLAKVNAAIKAQPHNLTMEQEKRNTYLNERDKLLKELSSKLDLQVRYNKDDSVDVFSTKGHVIVLGDRNFLLAATQSTKTLDGGLETQTIDISIDGKVLTKEFKKGKLAAVMEYQRNLEDVMTKLNKFAISFKDENNAIHATGYGLDGETGRDLFVGNNIKDIVINQELIDDPAKIATSSAANEASNNDTIKKIYDLKDKAIANFDNRTFYDYYIHIVGDIANAKDFHTKMATDSQMLVDAVDSKLQEISGVNMDEELMNLMQLQHAYQAAAKVINVTDELLETVMGLVR